MKYCGVVTDRSWCDDDLDFVVYQFCERGGEEWESGDRRIYSDEIEMGEPNDFCVIKLPSGERYHKWSYGASTPRKDSK